jgi:hypothetical protein
LGVGLKTGPIPLDAVVEAEIRNSSRPGSQAPHAPPALTFGLPGKQKVKSRGTACVLIRRVNGLPQFREILSIGDAGFPGNSSGARWSMIRKSGYRFSERIMLK